MHVLGCILLLSGIFSPNYWFMLNPLKVDIDEGRTTESGRVQQSLAESILGNLHQLMTNFVFLPFILMFMQQPFHA